MDVIVWALSKKYTNSVALNGVPINYPQIDSGNQHWKIFNPVTNTYTDTGVVARGVSPRIDGTSKRWLVWSDSTNAYVDSGVLAQGQDGYTPVKGVDYFDGNDGKQIELTNDGINLKWRYMGDTAWTNIAAIADLMGKNGESPVLRVYNGILQYKYPNDTVWQNLYTFPAAGDIEDLISSDAGNALEKGSDDKLFVSTGSYKHIQDTPDTTWLIQHNLNRIITNVLIVDTNGDTIVGERDMKSSTMNLFVVKFSVPVAGIAYV